MKPPILTKETYFSKKADMYYTGSSQIKSFLECEERTLAELNGEWERETTTALLVGSYVDAALSGELDLFKAQHKEIFKRDGTLKTEYIQAEEALNRIKRDKLFMKYISGGKQQIFIGEIAGVPVKIKVDCYHALKALVDFKYIRDFEPIWNGEMKENWISYWNYFMQGSLYQEIVKQNIDLKLPFFITAITKTKTPDIEVIGLDQDILDKKLVEVEEILPHIQELKQGKVAPTKCGKCNYCLYTKELSAIRSCFDFEGVIL